MLQIDDEERFGQVVEEFSDTVYKIAYQNLFSRVDAEDIVQDVFLRLLRRKEGFADKEHLKAWLIRITINRCRDYGRFSFRQREVPLMEQDVQTEEKMGEKEEFVLSLLSRLKKQDRNILYLYYYEGYSIREIAAIVGKAAGTVGSTLARARAKLKGILEEEGYGYEPI